MLAKENLLHTIVEQNTQLGQNTFYILFRTEGYKEGGVSYVEMYHDVLVTKVCNQII